MIYNDDCISGSKKYFEDGSIDLIICDPPFGINEKSFDKHYNRNEEYSVEGYVEAPDDYYKFTFEWLSEASRILKKNGSIYIISGWSNSDVVGRAIRDLDLSLRNKIIWNFDFGVNTKKKYVTSHYEIFYIVKSKNSKPTFNTNCRFGSQEKCLDGNSILYQDLSSVWKINKEYHPNTEKNQNKLPEELIEKMILYSSNKKDLVCDFFLGNFTTAVVAKKNGRTPCGFELNDNKFEDNLELVNSTQEEFKDEVYSVVPANQGKTITEEEISDICVYFKDNINTLTKKQIVENLMISQGRGKFSILNIIDKYAKDYQKTKKNKRQTESLLDMFDL
jgi:site-specific DNA-methyltransferase (adenine-specific)